MKWNEIDKDSSRQVFEEYCDTKKVNCPEEYEELRKEICNMFRDTLSELELSPETIAVNNNSYKVDYAFGIKLYLLLTEKYGMTVREAATDGIWRYLSVYVVPDVVELRYGIDHPDRFWKKPKRLWLRVLWWYIYLSWQGSAEETINVLKDNSTDEITQLVDRCGRGGYRVELYRNIMKKYSELDKSQRRKKAIFRKMMALNTARVQAIEPALVLGGERKYVDDLCDYFWKQE